MEDEYKKLLNKNTLLETELLCERSVKDRLKKRMKKAEQKHSLEISEIRKEMNEMNPNYEKQKRELEMLRKENINLKEELRIKCGMNECLIRGMQDDTEKHRWEMSKLHEEMNKMKDDYESKIKRLDKEAYYNKSYCSCLSDYIKSLEQKLKQRGIPYNKEHINFEYDIQALNRYHFK